MSSLTGISQSPNLYAGYRSRVSDATHALSESVQNALVPASVPSGDISSKLQDIAQQFLQIQHKGQERVNVGIRHTRDVSDVLL